MVVKFDLPDEMVEFFIRRALADPSLGVGKQITEAIKYGSDCIAAADRGESVGSFNPLNRRYFEESYTDGKYIINSGEKPSDTNDSEDIPF